MKKGITYWSIPGNDIKDRLTLAAELGFDGVELSFDGEGAVTANTTKEEAEELLAFAKGLGLEFQSMTCGLAWKYSITADDEEMRETAKQVIRDNVRVASYFGIKNILIVPGWVKVPWLPSAPVVDYDKAYTRALEALKEVAPVAEEYDVTICLENVGNMFLLSPVEMREFIDRVGSTHVASYFDVGNVLNIGCPEHWIRALGSRIKRVHVKDYTMVSGEMFVNADLLGGSIDYNEVMKAFREIGYDEWITAEQFGYKDKPGKIIMLKHTIMAMDHMINNMGK